MIIKKIHYYKKKVHHYNEAEEDPEKKTNFF